MEYVSYLGMDAQVATSAQSNA